MDEYQTHRRNDRRGKEIGKWKVREADRDIGSSEGGKLGRQR